MDKKKQMTDIDLVRIENNCKLLLDALNKIKDYRLNIQITKSIKVSLFSRLLNFISRAFIK